MSLRQVDLNLFRVFEAVLKHRSITGASRELHLTPSAVSHALTRLRTVLSDKLFIVSDTGMAPTARALELAPSVREGLEKIELALKSQPFVAAQARRTFRIAASDYGAATMMPRLVAQITRHAPQVELRILPFSRRDTVRQLEDGRIDLAISWFSELPSHMRRQLVWTDVEAIVVRPGHPLTEGPLSRERLLAYPHVAIELHGDGEAPDAAGYLDERGVSRRVRIEHMLLNLRRDGAASPRATISLPYYASVAPLIHASDMVGTLPRTLALKAAERGEVAILSLPYEPMVAHLEAIWHQRSDLDGGIKWLVDSIAAAESRTAGTP